MTRYLLPFREGQEIASTSLGRAFPVSPHVAKYVKYHASANVLWHVKCRICEDFNHHLQPFVPYHLQSFVPSHLYFSFVQGPLAWALIVWRCSLVFSSLDKIISVLIHLLPGAPHALLKLRELAMVCFVILVVVRGRKDVSQMVELFLCPFWKKTGQLGGNLWSVLYVSP